MHLKDGRSSLTIKEGCIFFSFLFIYFIFLFFKRVLALRLVYLFRI